MERERLGGERAVQIGSCTDKGRGISLRVNLKMECAIISLLVAVTVAVPVPEGEGYSEVGRMGLQLGQVLSRVEAQQEEMSKRLDELSKIVVKMSVSEAATGSALGCAIVAGEMVMPEGKERTLESEALLTGLEKLRTSVEAISER